MQAAPTGGILLYMPNRYARIKPPFLTVVIMICGQLCCGPIRAQGLTQTEEKKLQYCETGLAELNPSIASECLNERWMIDKVAVQDPAKAIRLTQKANALKDLGDLADIHVIESDFRMALTLRLEKGSPAVELGLGPEPEKFLDWVKTYKRDKLELAGAAVRSWNSLGENERKWLESTGMTAGDWGKLSLSERSKIFAPFNKAEALKLLATPSEMTEAAIEEIRGKAKSFWGDLDKGTKDKLFWHVDQLRTRLAVDQKASEMLKDDPAALRSLEGEFAGIKDLPVSEQLSRLNAFFDRSPALKNSEIAKIVHAQIPLAPNEAFTNIDRRTMLLYLQTALPKIISGTSSGDRVAAFFKKTPLIIKITPLPGLYGYNSGGIVAFSEELILKWMRVNGYTAKDLHSKKEPVQELSKFLSPLLIHEATHMEKFAWLKSEGLLDATKFNQEFEIECMSNEALFITEKMKEDPAFSEMFSRDYSPYLREEKENTRIFQADIRQFRNMVRNCYYTYHPSFEAVASANLSDAAAIAEELRRRESLPGPERDRLKAEGLDTDADLKENIAKIKTGVLERSRDFYLHWYSTMTAKIEDETKRTDEALKNALAAKSARPPRVPVP